MKKSIFTCLFIMLSMASFASFATNDWGASTNEIQLSIQLRELDKKEEKANKSVILNCSIKNNSTNEAISLYLPNAIEDNSDFSWKIISPSGKSTFLVRAATNMPFSSGAILVVKPGKITSFDFNLSKLFNFEEVGSYKIIMITDLKLAKKNTSLTSNMLIVKCN